MLYVCNNVILNASVLRSTHSSREQDSRTRPRRDGLALRRGGSGGLHPARSSQVQWWRWCAWCRVPHHRRSAPPTPALPIRRARDFLRRGACACCRRPPTPHVHWRRATRCCCSHCSQHHHPLCQCAGRVATRIPRGHPLRGSLHRPRSIRITSLCVAARARPRLCQNTLQCLASQIM